jgi:hypothetical protein
VSYNGEEIHDYLLQCQYIIATVLVLETTFFYNLRVGPTLHTSEPYVADMHGSALLCCIAAIPIACGVDISKPYVTAFQFEDA